MIVGSKIVHSRAVDWLFLIFPIWIPIAYLISYSTLGSYGAYATFVFLFIVGESHFLATLFFFTEKNKNYILGKKSLFVFVPLALILTNLLLFFYNIKYAMILGGLLSSWHVTRQSIGILRLFSGRNKSFEFDIYLFSFFFVSIGFMRTIEIYLESTPQIVVSLINMFKNYHVFSISIFFALVWFILKIARIRRKWNLESIAIYAVGFWLYAPYVHMDPSVAAILGVSMHWSQYLTLVFAVAKRDGTLQYWRQRLLSRRYSVIVLTLLLIFFVADFQKVVLDNLIYLLLVPLTLQLLHYYYDGLIWKGSDPYLRANIFKHIFHMET